MDTNALAVRGLVEPLHAIGIDASESAAIEQMAVDVTDRPQCDCTHLGVRVEDIVTVPGDRLGLLKDVDPPVSLLDYTRCE